MLFNSHSLTSCCLYDSLFNRVHEVKRVLWQAIMLAIEDGLCSWDGFLNGNVLGWQGGPRFYAYERLGEEAV